MEQTHSFGYWLRRRRKALDLTQEELARRVGCVVTTIKKIEADARRPSKQLAERLAEILGIASEERAAFVQAARAERTVDELAIATRPPDTPLSPQQAIGILPRGTLTFLFTDIVGSTQLWEQHPQAMQQVLARHDAILRGAIEAHGGVVVKSTGDGVLAVFPVATDALAMALEAQRALQNEPWGATGPLTIRVALHAGAAEAREGDYFGPALNRVARLLAAGHGGQILLSLAAAELVRDHLPPEVALRDLGAHRLKDLTRPEQIVQVAAPGLPSDFPPLRTLNPRRTNLPVLLTPLIGREHELAGVSALLRQAKVRLVTLTGPGGIGKTRLSLQVAAELSGDFADGVYFVDLAPIRDASLVAATIAHTLGVRESGAQLLFERLKEYLRDKQILLLLDNFEQVLDAAAVAAELLAAAAQLKLLITSRERLHLRGEKEISVQPLALPDSAHLPALEQLSHYEAVKLFVERAIDARADFQLTNANAPAVAEICSRLDGLPLAIELAAARLKLFSTETLLARLSSRLVLLSGGARDLPKRQQTIRSTIAWSYELLNEAEQMLFRRLGVFVGGCTLEAVEAIGNVDGDLSFDAVDGVARLLDKSLLRQEEEQDGEPRFTMLETIREYALERMSTSREVEALRQWHAIYYLRLAEAAEPELIGRDQIRWLARLDAEQDNLRAALAWALEQQVEAGLRLAAALRWFWVKRGLLSEGRRWLKLLLARSEQAQVSGSILADAQSVAGDLARWQEDARNGTPLLEAALRWYQSVGEQPSIADVLHVLGWVIWMQGDVARSVMLFDESLVCYRELGDARGIATVLLPRSYLTPGYDGDFERAVTMAEESLHLFREVGDLDGVATALRHVGLRLHDHGRFEQAADKVDEALRLARESGLRGGLLDAALYASAIVATSRGDLVRARMLQEERLILARESGHTRDVSAALVDLAMTARYQGNLVEAQMLIDEVLRLEHEVPMPYQTAAIRQAQGNLAYDQGDFARASNFYRESLTIARHLEEKRDCLACLEGLAAVACAQGCEPQAVRLWSSAEAIRETIGAPLPPIDYPRRESALTRLRAQLDEATFAAAWAEGRAMSLHQAISYALDMVATTSRGQASAPSTALQ